MRAILLILTIFSIGCAEKLPPLDLGGLAASNFKVHEQSALGGVFAVENSYVYKGQSLMSLYDLGATGEMTLGTISTDQRGILGATSVLPSNARFSYVIEHDGEYLNFVTRGGHVYMMSSQDLVNWQDEDEVLENIEDPSDRRHQQWNAAVAFDDSGVGHMMIETADATPGQNTVGLVYLKTSPNALDFTETTVPDILGGGNAWIHYIDGKGLLAIHGGVNHDNGPVWRIRASVLPIGATEWVEASIQDFDISMKGIHIADPHAIELKDGRILLSVSVDQVKTLTLMSKNQLTFSQLFDQILEQSGL